MAPGSKSIDMLLFGQTGAPAPGEATLHPNSPDQPGILPPPVPKTPAVPHAPAPPAPAKAVKPAPKTGSVWPAPPHSFMAPSSKLGLIFFTPWGPVRTGPFVTAKIVDEHGVAIVDDEEEERVEGLPIPELPLGSQPPVDFSKVQPPNARP
jgi:hypothetical protein